MGVVAFVAQQILDRTTVNMGNVTMLPCFTPHAELINSVQIHIPGPFGATVHPFEYKMSTRGCPKGGEWHCDNPHVVELGRFTAPELQLKPGANEVQFSAGATLADASSLLSNFILPLFINGENATLVLDGEDMDIQVLKIPLKKMHLKNTLTCYKVAILPPSEIPVKYCGNASEALSTDTFGRRLDTGSGYVIKCKDHKDSKEVSIVV
jgi:hypothetical protein